MLIETFAREEEDTDLLINTLNAEAGRFLYSDPHLRIVLLRAQAAIVSLEKLLDTESYAIRRIRHEKGTDCATNSRIDICHDMSSRR